MRTLPFALLLAAASGPLAAQPFTRQVTPFPVATEAGDLPFPFVGGFFEPRPALVDIDADGDADLILNVGGAGLQLFERDGGTWVWKTDQLGGIEPGNWSVFGDLDRDGDLDLLSRGDPGRVRYWRNVGTAERPEFELGAETLLDAAGQPVHVEDSSIPALGDLDGDGDPDLFSGKADIGTITYYRTDGVDAAGVPVLTFVTDRYQDIVVYEENPQCRSASAPPVGRGSMRHGANAIAIQDLDGDGPPELFWGDFFAPSLFYFVNQGTTTAPALVLGSERFPVGQPLSSGGYNAPTYGDLDGDGDADLVVGVQRGLCFQAQTSISNLITFENAGTPEAPDLQLRTDRSIIGLDVGSRSTAALADLDGDGDLDLVLASESNLTDLSRATLDRYENVGTASAPAFRLAEADWLALAYDYGAYAPVFGDLDGDGDLDLLVGGFNGRFARLQNNGPAANPEFSVVDERFGGIDVGQYARGALGDLDGDGDLDLVGGASNGKIRIYRNTGSAQSPAFETASNGTPGEADLAFQLQIGLPEAVDGDSAPALGDLDGDGDLDLLMGTASGALRVFENVGTRTAPQFREAEAIPAGRRRTAPTMGDLDGDGRPEVVAGTAAGGFLFWHNGAGTFGEARPAPGSGLLRVVPNPSTGAVAFQADAEAGEVVVFDAVGRRVVRLALAAGAAEWDGHDGDHPAAAGVYLAQLRADDLVETVPFTRVR